MGCRHGSSGSASTKPCIGTLIPRKINKQIINKKDQGGAWRARWWIIDMPIAQRQLTTLKKKD
jgi:hypothetical protein